MGFFRYTLKETKYKISTMILPYIFKHKREKSHLRNRSAIQYDKLNDRINPTDGYRIRLDFDYFGLVGDSEHILTELKIAHFYRIADGFVQQILEGGYIVQSRRLK